MTYCRNLNNEFCSYLPPTLLQLDIASCFQISDEGKNTPEIPLFYLLLALIHLSARCPSLVWLNLTYLSITDEGLSSLLEKLKKIQHLKVNHCPIGLNSLRPVALTLKSLEIVGCNISQSEVESILKVFQRVLIFW